MELVKRVGVIVVVLGVLGALGFLIYKDINLQRSLNTTNQSLTALSKQVKVVNNNVGITDSDVTDVGTKVDQVCSSISTC